MALEPIIEALAAGIALALLTLTLAHLSDRLGNRIWGPQR